MTALSTVELIRTTELRGNGTPQNLKRHVTQLYTFDGRLVAEFDPAYPHNAKFDTAALQNARYVQSTNVLPCFECDRRRKDNKLEGWL